MMAYNNNNQQYGSNQQYGQGNPYGGAQQYGIQSNPYQRGPTAEQGYGQQGGGYGQPQQEGHELQNYGQPYEQQPSAAPQVLSQQDFLKKVAYVRDNDMRTLQADIDRVGELHARALDGSDPNAQRQLDALVSETQLKNTRIRDQLRTLKNDVEKTTDPGSRGLKTRQLKTLNDQFKSQVEGYLQKEQQYKENYRRQIARQYRIVNPDATDDEVRQAADADWGNEGIFQTALRTNRSGQANAVLGAVRARHNELVKIEDSIRELAGLFQDLDTLVIQQEPTIIRAEEQTEQTNVHLDQGTQQVAQATKSAKRARRLKWWCALVVVLIVIAIALGVGLGVALTRNATKTS